MLDHDVGKYAYFAIHAQVPPVEHEFVCLTFDDALVAKHRSGKNIDSDKLGIDNRTGDRKRCPDHHCASTLMPSGSPEIALTRCAASVIAQAVAVSTLFLANGTSKKFSIIMPLTPPLAKCGSFLLSSGKCDVKLSVESR
jgi:hypothetical protein